MTDPQYAHVPALDAAQRRIAELEAELDLATRWGIEHDQLEEARERIKALGALILAQDDCSEKLANATENAAHWHRIAAIRAKQVRELQAERASYDSATAASIDAATELRAEVARLRDIISPGDAAAYEEGMAAREAEIDRLRDRLAAAWKLGQEKQEEIGRLSGNTSHCARCEEYAREVELAFDKGMERAAEVVREECSACDMGHTGTPDGIARPDEECMYCGIPVRDIGLARAALKEAPDA